MDARTVKNVPELWAAIDEHVAELIAHGKVVEFSSTDAPQTVPEILDVLEHGDVVYDPTQVEHVVEQLRHLATTTTPTASYHVIDWHVRYEIAPTFGLLRWHDDPDHEFGGEWVRAMPPAWFEHEWPLRLPRNTR